MSTENIKLKSKKDLMKLTKKEILENLKHDTFKVNAVFKEKDSVIDSKYKLISELEKRIDELESINKEMIKIDETKNKDLSIMQQALNDVEEKNRALNVQLLDLRKALKTTSQYL